MHGRLADWRLRVITLCAIFVGVTNASAPGRDPNVVFILVDDLGWRDLGCYGSPVYETPAVDRLAQQGMRFTDFYAAGPVCSPTRASILTGKNPARLGITTYLLSPDRDPAHVVHHLPLAELTLAEAFAGSHYATGFFGKWHLGYRREHWADKQGFAVAKGGIDLPWAWQLCWPNRDAPTGQTWPQEHTRFFSPYHLTHLENGPEGEYLTDRLTSETISFIEQNRDRPFFVMLSFHTVHTPLQAKPSVVENYRHKIAAMPFGQRKESNPKFKRYQNNPAYAAMVHHMDENVGRLLERITELGLQHHTIVVFTSDNGGKGSVTSNHPLRGAKHDLHEGGIRVPLIVSWPDKIAAGSTSDCPLISHDFFPTLLSLTEANHKGDRCDIDGRSFAEILLGRCRRLNRPSLCWHYPHNRQQAAIRSGKYKLIQNLKDGRTELYDLSVDIGETANLSSAQPQRTRELLRELLAWQTDVGARFATAALYPDLIFLGSHQARRR